MTEQVDVKTYLSSLPKLHQAGFLTDLDRTICYVIHNRLKNAIDVTNPRYKRMADLMKESVLAVREMRDDVEIMIRKRYSEIILVDNITVHDAIIELGEIELDNHQNCINYLNDLAEASLVTLQSNEDLESSTAVMFNTLIYICVIALNLFNTTNEMEPVVEGVDITFDRKRVKQ